MSSEINDNLVKIVNILRQESVLLRNIVLFMDLLLISNSTKVFVTRGISQGTSYYELLRTILEEWSSQNGKKASVKSLVERLRDGEFNSCADSIEASIILPTRQLSVLEPEPNQPHSSQQHIPQVKPQIASATTIEDDRSIEDKKRQERVAGWLTKYKVLDFLGCGAFGLVFKVQNIEKPNDLSAVKMLVPQVYSASNQDANSDEVLQANNELQIMKGRKNENVVTLIRSDILPPNNGILQAYGEKLKLGESNDGRIKELYFTLKSRSERLRTIIFEIELCGPTLRSWLGIDRPGNVTEDFAKLQFEIANGLIKGLKSLHDQKIIHRDLKPENVYFSFDNREGKDYKLPIKIGDFGLSRQMSGERTVTETEDKGTYLYKAPEVHTKKYGLQADLYSLGLILLEIFYCPSKTIDMVATQFADFKDRKNYIQQNKWIPQLFETIIKLTERKPENRKTIEDVHLEFKTEQSDDLC